MNLLQFWCANIALVSLKSLTKHKGNILKAAAFQFREHAFAFVFVYIIEIVVFGSALIHPANRFVTAYLLVEFAMSIRYMIDFRYRNEVYLLA